MQTKAYRFESLGPTHRKVVELVGRDAKVLEVGCAAGHMTQVLREQLRCEVTAVEVNSEEAAQAKPYAERLIVGDIEEPEIWEQVGGPFDCAIFADVLEHLIDPWEVLRRTRNVLAQGGFVVASIPNVAYYKMRKELLLGRFDYSDYGILDDTHLRFFTAKSARALFTESGYDVESFRRTFRGRTDRRLWWLCPNAFTYQFVVRAVAR